MNKFERHIIWFNLGTNFYRATLPKFVFGCAKALAISTWFINIDTALTYKFGGVGCKRLGLWVSGLGREEGGEGCVKCQQNVKWSVVQLSLLILK